ncbi:MAG: VWA domain-containing protein [Gammaproteobacteria bacterium]|jgi:Ca-activated chloride channel family protein
MSAFHFLRPAWFLTLVPALVLLVLLWRRGARATAWQGLVSPRLLPHLLLDGGQSARRFPLVLLGLGWLLAVTALAGPTWERQPQPVYRAPADRVIVLDMSPSMAAADLRPDRLTRARFVIRNILSGMREGRTALVVFGAEPHVVVPLTDDVATIEALLPALTVDILPAPGDRGGPALRAAGELLQRVGSTRGEVLLLSDGVADPADSLDVLHALRGRGVRTSVLGVGTPAGAPVPAPAGGFAAASDGGVRLARLDEPGLAALARAGGGRYLRLGEGPAAGLLMQDVGRDPARALADAQGLERWVEKGPWLLLPLVLIAAFGFRRGWLGVLVLLAMPAPPVQAFGWQDLWWRPDQQASRLLEQGEAAAAAERFQDPDWRATARYRAGDYTAAAEGFAGNDPDSSYNRGNALARAGRLQEALAAYERTLQQQPDHADARFNRALIEKLLRERQQQSGQDKPSRASRGGQPGAADGGAGAQAGAEQNTGGQGGTAQNAGGQQGTEQNAGANDGDRQNAAAHDSTETLAGGQQPEEAQAGQPEAGDTGNEARTKQSPGGVEGTDRDPSTGAGRREQTAGGQADAQGRRERQPPAQTDTTEQVRSDVAPTANRAAPGHTDAQDRTAAAVAHRQSAQPELRQPEPPSEQELALEQWLRQVPDDPAGLLRRKFLLEHLLRQKGQEDTP